MPAMSTLQPLETIDFPGFDSAVVRFRGQTLDRMHEAMDHAFGLLGEAIQAGRFRPAGPAFARYEGDVRQGLCDGVDLEVGLDRKSTRLNSSHSGESRMPSSA